MYAIETFAAIIPKLGLDTRVDPTATRFYSAFILFVYSAVPSCNSPPLPHTAPPHGPAPGFHASCGPGYFSLSAKQKSAFAPVYRPSLSPTPAFQGGWSSHPLIHVSTIIPYPLNDLMLTHSRLYCVIGFNINCYGVSSPALIALCVITNCY